MFKKMFDRTTTNYFFIIIFAFLLFMGGFGTNIIFWNSVGSLFGIILLIYLVLKQGPLKIPPHFYLFITFLALFVLSLIWSIDFTESFKFLLLFVGGCTFWLAFYNLKHKIENKFELMILFLGIAFGGLAFAGILFQWPQMEGLSLIFNPSLAHTHHHIGDFWAVVTVVAVYKLFKSPRNYLLWLFIPVALFLFAISLSRAAYLSLFAGVLFLAYKEGILKNIGKYKFISIIFAVSLLSLFFLVATQKSILFSRPYFIQTFLGLIKNPFGIGVGNFVYTSYANKDFISGLNSFSFYAHNIFLEVISGMGILGLSFIFWFIKVFTKVMNSSNSRIIFTAIFLVLTVNFMFDITYFNPTMMWLWFISLGLAQNKVNFPKI